MRLLAAILIGKLISFIIKVFKLGGGSAAPGLYALKIYPELVEELSHKIPKNIIITGTNGKTTTARMVTHFAKESGLKVIRNHTGSNLERGIASALISHVHLRGVHLGIWELDEAAFNSVAPKIKPDIIVFLNVFRDQLDRYGEVDSVVIKWVQTLKKLPQETMVLVNGDDDNTHKLKDHFQGRVETFGVEGFKIVGESIDPDLIGVERHKTQPQLDFEAKNVKLNGLSGSFFQLTVNNKLLTINLPLPGLYHIYDALAAIVTAFHLGLPINRLTDQLINYIPAFGRFEKLPFGAIFLIKNPAGATQVFETLAPQIKLNDRLLLSLNDNLADGTDISWIWDADFEKLLPNSTHKPNQKSAGVATISPPGWKPKILVSGTRAEDLAVRLKYAGFEAKQLSIVPNLERALKRSREGLKGSLYILPTYTAMLELQNILVKMGIKTAYWHEN